jgi:multidrug resistance efflux pump
MSGTASIYSLAAEERARASAAAWARFATTQDRTEFCIAWLTILCAQVDRANFAVVLLGPDAEGAFAPAAIWPHPSQDLGSLSAAAEQTLAERRGIVAAREPRPATGGGGTRERAAQIGYPIEVAGTLHGAVVLDIKPSTDADLQRILRMVHWSSAWLVDHVRQAMVRERDARVSHMGAALDLITIAMREPGLKQSTLAVVNELSAKLACDRVSIGLDRKGRIAVEAISNTAIFDPRMSLVRVIGDAMEEALDLDDTVLWPAGPDDENGAIAHTELARELKDVAICSVPLRDAGHLVGGRLVGVLTLERGSGPPFDAITVELCRAAADLLGPILALKRDNERGVAVLVGSRVAEAVEALAGPRHPGVKLLTGLAAAVLLFLVFASGPYRVGARTVVEGAVQRAVVAPYDGRIAQSFVRAGDIVRSGQELVRLDDHDLKLEFARLGSEREQNERKSRQALASQDRGEMMVSAARIAETDAELSLLSDKLARASLAAPFDGVVVSGDLSQLLGTPVDQGKLLFQISPLNAYRVVLEVDERDIAAVALGQTGELTLSGLAGQSLPFSVQQITPVASQQEGRNFFRVEARLEGDADRVRPGMEGVGKINAGERKLIWIWTHALVDWLRFWTWKELP